jgi:hypothetical protein
MTLQCIVGICISVVITSEAAVAQPRSEAPAPGLIRHETTVLVRDINGGWRSIEVRRGEARTGPSERVEEETIQRRDLNGGLAVTERNVTSRSRTNGQEQAVIETYTPYSDGISSLALSQRVQRTTTATADGGRYTVEEVETRSRVAPTEPMRVTDRTLTTVRPAGAGRWVSERQVFKRDLNGQMRLVVNETEDLTGE